MQSKRWVFSRRTKTGSDVADLIAWGSLFQTEAAATTKARLPIVECRVLMAAPGWSRNSDKHNANGAELQTSRMRSCSRRFISSSRSLSRRFSSSCLCSASCFFWLTNASSSCQPVTIALYISNSIYVSNISLLIFR